MQLCEYLCCSIQLLHQTLIFGSNGIHSGNDDPCLFHRTDYDPNGAQVHSTLSSTPWQWRSGDPIKENARPWSCEEVQRTRASARGRQASAKNFRASYVAVVVMVVVCSKHAPLSLLHVARSRCSVRSAPRGGGGAGANNRGNCPRQLLGAHLLAGR